MAAVGIKPKGIGGRTLTDAEVRASQGETLTAAERADLERAGWTFADVVYDTTAMLPPMSPAEATAADAVATVLGWHGLDAAGEPLAVDGPPADGLMLAAVRADLATIDQTGPGRQSMAQLALWLASVIDSRGTDGGATTAARLAQELRATMVALTTERGGTDPDTLRQLLAGLSTPDRGVPDVR